MNKLENDNIVSNKNEDGGTDTAREEDEPWKRPRKDDNTDTAREEDESSKRPRVRQLFLKEDFPTYHMYLYNDRHLKLWVQYKSSICGQNMKIRSDYVVEDGPNKLTVKDVKELGVVMIPDHLVDEFGEIICDDEEVGEIFRETFKYGVIVDVDKKFEGWVTIVFGLLFFDIEIEIKTLEKASKKEARRMLAKFRDDLHELYICK